MKRIVGLVAISAAVILILAIKLVSSGTSAGSEFGVVANPWSINKWSIRVGAKPTMPMQFVAWSTDDTLVKDFAQARQDGFSSYMVTWEPWTPVPANLGQAAQAAPQPFYSNQSIADGAHDAYIKAFALSVAKSGLKNVYIRYGHEMNGSWYPWSSDSSEYILAWRHIVNIFRANGASNAKFVYSTNPNLYQTNAAWKAGFWQYWPGSSYVNYIGSTMINFGSTSCSSIPCPLADKGYSVSLLGQRIIMGHQLSGKQLFIAEFNTSLSSAVPWLTDFSRWLKTNHSWIKGVVLSQQASRASAQIQTGDLDWSVLNYPKTFPILRTIIDTETGR